MLRTPDHLITDNGQGSIGQAVPRRPELRDGERTISRAEKEEDRSIAMHVVRHKA